MVRVFTRQLRPPQPVDLPCIRLSHHTHHTKGIKDLDDSGSPLGPFAVESPSFARETSHAWIPRERQKSSDRTFSLLAGYCEVLRLFIVESRVVLWIALTFLETGRLSPRSAEVCARDGGIGA